MEFLLIIPIGLYMLVFIPAFMFTWEGSVFNGIGCYGWFCMLLGFPGALLAWLIKGIIKLFKLPGEIKAEEEHQRCAQQQALEQRRREEQEAKNKRIYQDSLIEKRDKIYPNSPVTREIVEIITQGKELPHSIELNNTGLTFYFENSTKSYVYRTHGLPDMDQNEEKIFADVLNQKLSSRYSVTEMTKYHSFKHSDGTLDGYTMHIGTKMLLKTTRTF